MQLLNLLPLQQLFARNSSQLLRSLKRAGERCDERVEILAVEGIEPISETAHADRVERQTDHVLWYIDHVVRIHPLPLHDQLAGDVGHHGQIAAHCLLAEGRQQDVMCLGPIRIVGISSKEPVTANQAKSFQRAAHRFVEALLITHFGNQISSRHDNERRAHHIELEDRTILIGQFHQRLDLPIGINRQSIADQRLAGWLRYRSERTCPCHARYLADKAQAAKGAESLRSVRVISRGAHL